MGRTFSDDLVNDTVTRVRTTLTDRRTLNNLAVTDPSNEIATPRHPACVVVVKLRRRDGQHAVVDHTLTTDVLHALDNVGDVHPRLFARQLDQGLVSVDVADVDQYLVPDLRRVLVNRLCGRYRLG